MRDALREALSKLDPRDVDSLRETGARCRRALREAPWPPELLRELEQSYAALSGKYGQTETDVAVRSSATAEDLPGASFAGQQETYLNVHGVPALVDACRRCFASLYTDRAISYRAERGFEHEKVYLSIGVQKMIRSDQAGSGVLFTLDTESGFDGVVFITAIYGLGENIVQGVVNPDEYMVFKSTMAEISRRLGTKEIAMVYDEGGQRSVRNVPVPESLRRQFVLSREETVELARYAVAIEKHYTERAGERRPMDIEWAKDGKTGQLFIVQARPETAHAQRDLAKIVSYELQRTRPGARARARRRDADRRRPRRAARQLRAAPRVHSRLRARDRHDRPRLGADHEARRGHRDGPRRAHLPRRDRVARARHPVRRRCRRRHDVLASGDPVTVSCAEGETGLVMEGILPFERVEFDLKEVPRTRSNIYLNVGNPDQAFALSFLPVDGVGLAREEFIIMNAIGIHPLALIHPERVDEAARREIAERTRGYPSGAAFFVDKLAEGVARIAAAFHPRPGDRPPLGLQDQRVRRPARRRRLRAEGGEPDDRVPRRLPLRPRRLPRGLRARVPRAPARARGHGSRERDPDDPVLPHHRRGGARPGGDGEARAGSRAARAPGLRDVRDPLERAPDGRSSPSTSTASRSARTT